MINNKHWVKFVRGTQGSWDALQETPEKIDNDTLYFIYEDEDSSTIGKLYLGKKLISDNDILNLENYYTKEEIHDLLPSKISDLINDNDFITYDTANNIVLNAISNITNLHFEIVQEKPIENIQENVIYLILKNSPDENNTYEEWIYIDNKWELIGTTDIDLSQYQSKIFIENHQPYCYISGSYIQDNNIKYSQGDLYLDISNNNLYYLNYITNINIDNGKVYDWISLKNREFYYDEEISQITNNQEQVFDRGYGIVNSSTFQKDDIVYCPSGIYKCLSVQGKQFAINGSSGRIMRTYQYSWEKLNTNYYTKNEINNFINNISTLSFEIAQNKPNENIQNNIIYLIPKEDSENENIYDEWIYLNNNWELLGTTDIDLSQYYTKNETDNLLTRTNKIFKKDFFPPYYFLNTNKEESYNLKVGDIWVYNNDTVKYNGAGRYQTTFVDDDNQSHTFETPDPLQRNFYTQRIFILSNISYNNSLNKNCYSWKGVDQCVLRFGAGGYTPSEWLLPMGLCNYLQYVPTAPIQRGDFCNWEDSETISYLCLSSTTPVTEGSDYKYTFGWYKFLSWYDYYTNTQVNNLLSNKLDKQSTIPEVQKEANEDIPDITDLVFTNLAPTQLFKCEINNEYKYYMKITDDNYVEIGDIATEEDVNSIIENVAQSKVIVNDISPLAFDSTGTAYPIGSFYLENDVYNNENYLYYLTNISYIQNYNVYRYLWKRLGIRLYKETIYLELPYMSITRANGRYQIGDLVWDNSHSQLLMCLTTRFVGMAIANGQKVENWQYTWKKIELSNNKTTSLSAQSTDEEYPSAKAVYDAIENISLTPGPAGTNGKSAYAVAVEEGFNGTQQEWLASLIGAQGPQGIQGATGAQGVQGSAGADGKSAYQIAVDNGFVGTEQEWLVSLVGATGQTGAQGPAGADWVPTENELNNIATRVINLLPSADEEVY